MRELPREFVEQMERELGADAPAFFSTYKEDCCIGLRVNARKGFVPGEGFAPVPWCPSGYYVPAEVRMGKQPLHAAGAYYLQEPSAMAPAEALGVRPGMRVLDLCAAPGGKSTQLADQLQGRGLLVANEIHPARSHILLENVERMGVRNALVLNETPARIASAFGPWFDAVLVDAPCSGEGMFRKNPQAAEQWSVRAPMMCHERQLEILESAAICLRGGGALVYSTCTYNRLENEDTVAQFLERHPEFMLDYELALTGIPCTNGMAHLYPHQIRGEGHFLARMIKRGEEVREHPMRSGEKPDERFVQFVRETLREAPEEQLFARGDWLYALPEGIMPAIKGLNVLSAGIQVGRLAAGRMEPAHAWALALSPKQVVRAIEVDQETALRYLKGETLPGGFKGWGLVTHQGFALGWGKGSGGMVKNHIPKGLRWH